MSAADSYALMRDAQLQSERKADLMKKEQTRISRDGDTDRKRHAWVKPSPAGEPGRWLVWRKREDGSLDLVTAFYIRRRAEKAARSYEQCGEIKGLNF